jgi:hypothetical protein
MDTDTAAVHDTGQTPEIARNFGWLPEQLLEHVKQLRNG